MPILAMSAGTVTAIWGNAFIRQADGTLTPVKVGDKVKGGEQIITDADGLVQISPAKGHPQLLKTQAEAPAVDKAIAGIEAQDPQEAPAAGLTGGADGGMQPGLRVERVSESTSPSDLNLGTAAAGNESAAPQTGSSADQRALASTPLSQASIDDIVVNEGSGTATFTVTLDKPSTGIVTIPFATRIDTAKTGDFTPATGTLTFQPGELSKTIKVAITNDAIYEGEERFSVQLGSPTNALLSKGEGSALIHDEDDRPHVTVSDAQTSEGGTLEFHVQLSNDSVTENHVTLKLTGLGHLTPDDLGEVRIYQGGTDGPPLEHTVNSDGSLVFVVHQFTPADTDFVVQVDTKADTVPEGPESVQLSVTTDLDPTPVVATGTILDDRPYVLVLNGEAANEGEYVGFNVVLTRESSEPVTVKLTLQDGSDDPTTPENEGAQLGLDTDTQLEYELPDGTWHALPDSGVLTFDPHQTQLHVRVLAFDDQTPESTEFIKLQVHVVEGITVNTDHANQTAIVNANDQPPYLLVLNGEPAVEGEKVGFNLVLTHPSAEAITVQLDLASGVDDPYSLANESAKLGVDTGTALEWESAPGVWEAVSGPLTFAPGATQHHVRVATIDDQEPEAIEFIKLQATVLEGHTANQPDASQLVVASNQTAIDDNDLWPDPVNPGNTVPYEPVPDHVQQAGATQGVSDVFAWHLSEQRVDVIQGFELTAPGEAGKPGGDVLDLRDLLHGEEAAGVSLDQFLHFDHSAFGTVIKIAADGDMVDGHSASNVDSLHIVLENVNLPAALGLDAHASDMQIITKLVQQGNLLVDHA